MDEEFAKRADAWAARILERIDALTARIEGMRQDMISARASTPAPNFCAPGTVESLMQAKDDVPPTDPASGRAMAFPDRHSLLREPPNPRIFPEVVEAAGFPDPASMHYLPDYPLANPGKSPNQKYYPEAVEVVPPAAVKPSILTGHIPNDRF